MKNTKKLLALLLVIAMIFALAVPAFAEEETSTMEGKTVILHSNDVHGAIAGYANMAALAAEYEAQGAQVIVADAGDFSQGKVEVSSNKGLNAVKMMNVTGYDIATIGNHEFDYGYAQLVENLKEAQFDIVCCNVLDEDGSPVFDGSKIVTVGDLKIGFIGVNTPESQTKANPALIQGLKWLAGEDMTKAVQAEADKLQGEADVIGEEYAAPRGSVSYSMPFEDVSAGAYFDSILWAYTNGITKGTSDTAFSPDKACTRAQIITLMYRAAGSPEVSADVENPFTDVSEDSVYYNAIMWAYENGITEGTTKTTFSPNAACTRAQIVTFQWRANGSEEVETWCGFTDVPQFNSYYAMSVSWAVEKGIAKGTSDTTFSPNDPVTRAQAVTFLHRAQ